MASFTPSTITAGNYPIAQKATFGGEATLYASRVAAVELGRFTITAADTGTYTANSGAAIPETTADLVAVVINQTGLYGGAANVVLTVSGTDSGAAAITGTATYQTPGWVRNSARSFGIGYGVDVVQSSSTKFASVTGVTVDCNADAVGSVIAIYAMPSTTSFGTVAGLTAIPSFSTKSAQVKAIPEGLDGTKYTKFGRSEQARMSVEAYHLSFGDGLPKWDGVPATVKVEVKKEGLVVVENLYFTGVRLKSTPNFPEGDSEAKDSAEGVYEQFIYMPAL